MPLPLIPLVIGALSTTGSLAGIFTGSKGVNKILKAKDIVKKAENKYQEAQSLLNARMQATSKLLENYGQMKIEICKSLKEGFFKSYKRIKKNATFKEFANTKTFVLDKISDKELDRFEKDTVSTFLTACGGLVSGGASGAGIYFGAYGAVAAFGHASTGTAISTLSGAAASNATLAWFGGGACASGGFGIAGGTLVLGGLSVAPALLIGGLMIGKKGEKVLTKAIEYEAKVEMACKEIEISITLLDAIDNRIYELAEVCLKVKRQLDMMVKKMDRIILPNYKPSAKVEFSADDIATIKQARILAIYLKRILEIEVIDLNGKASKKEIPRFNP